MRILGIDPGYERLGIAVLEKPQSVKASRDKSFGSRSICSGQTAQSKSCGCAQDKEQIIFSECFKTSAKLEFNERLHLIGEEIKNVIQKYNPEILSIETLFLNTNQKTAMRVAEARGVIIYEAARAGLEIFEASPLQIKIAVTGYGKATKEQMEKMVKMLIDVEKSKALRLGSGQASDDELDAVAIALTAFACIKNANEKS